MATTHGTGEATQHPEGIFSIFDTDLYKLTMQCAVLKFFPDVQVSYSFTNRTPHMRLDRAAFTWLQEQVKKLGDVKVNEEEILWLKKTCPYLNEEYLEYLQGFRLKPDEHLKLSFTPNKSSKSGNGEKETGDISLHTSGLWLETILYEIPLLALVSEAYFKFVDTDWSHEGQLEKAYKKGIELIEHGCKFSEFGSRRRRDYKTHELVVAGLKKAQEEAHTNGKGWKGAFTGTSNVHLAMSFGVAPIGTVAHEWFMGIAAITDNYSSANELALQYWTGAFGRGVLSIALTDTFGTESFLKAFARPAPKSGTTGTEVGGKDPSYAEIFTGTRQDSGDPLEFVKTMRKFYDEQGITQAKIIVFSDSLNVEKCIKYKEATEAAGLTPSFGVGTNFTNDFVTKSSGEKSVPLNIVIKLHEAAGREAVKLSDNLGKNTGDKDLIKRVKIELGYHEKEWEEGDESHRWDK